MGLASKKMGFAKLTSDIAEQVWGFIPNRQVKPVHFANGFFRALCGTTGSVDLLLAAAGGFRKGTSRVSTEQWIADIDGHYESRSGSPPVDDVKNLRSTLDLVLNQDRALFASAQFASLTLTHVGHITSDRSDQGSGRFLASVLALGDDGKAAKALRRTLESKTDNIYMLTAPLVGDVQCGNPPVADADVEERVRNSIVLQEMRRAFGRVMTYERLLEKTMFLQRVVALGGFSLFLHLINSVQARPSGRTHVPLLLAAPGCSPEIREASRATFATARQQIVLAYEEGLRREMQARGEDELLESEYRELMRNWLPELDADTREGKKQTKTWERFEQDFSAFRLVADVPFEAFVRAAARAAFVAMAESGGADPEGVATALGRMIGIVYPRLQGRGAKYFSPAPQFLDMLVVTLLDPGESVALEEFWNRAYRTYGIVSGHGETADATRLRDWNIRRASPTLLKANADQLLDELVRMGHARVYADDIAMVHAGGRHG